MRCTTLRSMRQRLPINRMVLPRHSLCLPVSVAIVSNRYQTKNANECLEEVRNFFAIIPQEVWNSNIYYSRAGRFTEVRLARRWTAPEMHEQAHCNSSHVASHQAARVTPEVKNRKSTKGSEKSLLAEIDQSRTARWAAASEQQQQQQDSINSKH